MKCGNLTNQKIKKKMKEVASNRGMTMEELSLKMGKTKSYLASTFSKSKRLISLEILRNAAECLGCRICDFLED